MSRCIYLYVNIWVFIQVGGCRATISSTSGNPTRNTTLHSASSSRVESQPKPQAEPGNPLPEIVPTTSPQSPDEVSNVVTDPKYVTEYEIEFRKCKSQVVPRENPRELLDPYVLASAHAEFVVDGFGSLRVQDELGQGMYGKVFSFYETSAIILKGAKSDHGRDDLCWERSLQRVLGGLNGGAPRDHLITEMPAEFDPLFRSRVLVMDRKGDAEWGDVVLEENETFFIRFARLLTIVRDLHQKGFIHDDIKGCNIRVGITDPQDVTLIDFGQAVPFIDSLGHHLPDVTRKRDLVNLVEVARAIRGLKPWLVQFEDAVNQMTDSSDFDYNHWISKFRAMKELK